MSAFLLDTHVLLWWLFNDARLSYAARNVIEPGKHRILVSAGSAWEIATKYRLGKLPDAGAVVQEMPTLLARSRMEPVPITLEDALLAGSMLAEHRDPFDRMIAAQGLLREVPVVTNDKAFNTFNVQVVW